MAVSSEILAIYSFIPKLFLNASLCQALNTKLSVPSKLLCKRDKELTHINNVLLKMLIILVSFLCSELWGTCRGEEDWEGDIFNQKWIEKKQASL